MAGERRRRVAYVGPRCGAAGQPPWTAAGSETRGAMERRSDRRVVNKVRYNVTGIVRQVSEIVVRAIGGSILVKKGKVELYSLWVGATRLYQC